jgi:hypothetical protein
VLARGHSVRFIQCGLTSAGWTSRRAGSRVGVTGRRGRASRPGLTSRHSQSPLDRSNRRGAPSGRGSRLWLGRRRRRSDGGGGEGGSTACARRAPLNSCKVTGCCWVCVWGVGAVWVGARVRAMVLQIGQLTQSLKAASDDAAIQVLCAQASLSLSLSMHKLITRAHKLVSLCLSVSRPPPSVHASLRSR